MGIKNRFFLCMCSRNCIIVIIIIVLLVVVMMFQYCQVIVTSLGCCWYGEYAPRVLIVGKMDAGRWRVIAVLLLKMYMKMACEI